jgi:1,4-alpha-glucan branching enzyme
MPTKRARKAKTVQVTFTLPATIDAQEVALCGEFNNWSTDDIKLARNLDGPWRTIVVLEPGRSYRYRYLLDKQRWENAWHADDYVPNPYGGEDSVIVVLD